jgi:four helix bundle protein
MSLATMEAPNDIEEWTFAYALRIGRLCRILERKAGVSRSSWQQLLRAGSSIGTNVQESRAAQTRADFIHKNWIALKEARETLYWLRLIEESALIRAELLTSLVAKTRELTKILGAIVAQAPSQRVLHCCLYF